VIRKELDPTKGMMQNKLKLAKGHMPTIVKFVTSNKELVDSTTRVPTQFVDE
jgi:putative sterol carrier protein